jgi:hypothetical protein
MIDKETREKLHKGEYDFYTAFILTLIDKTEG